MFIPSRSSLVLVFAGLMLCHADILIAAEKPAYDQARELADKLKAAQKGGNASASAEATSKLPKGDPCKLLTDDEVRRAFPEAKAGQRERNNEQYGIAACVWKYPGG